MQTPTTQPERSEAPPPPEAEAEPVESGASPLREAMLGAIGALSDEERERLTAAEAPEETVRIWRDLVADRAMRERQSELVGEALDEIELRESVRRDEVRANRPRPTRDVRGGAPPREPSSVAEWTTHIRDAEAGPDAGERRSRFAAWLAANPHA